MLRPALCFTALIAAIAQGCVRAPPVTIDAGRLGTIAASPPQQGTYQEGASLEWKRFVLTAAVDGYAMTGSVPAGHVLKPAQVRHETRRLLDASTAVQWIGHATFLIKAGGLTLLTDPVFSDVAAPAPALGPRRYAPPAPGIDQLPHVDVILISHNHYDHLDAWSLERLAKRFPHAVVLLPDGDEKHALEAGFVHVHKHRPGQRRMLGEVRFLALPAYHQTSRMGLDANTTPVLSWSIRTVDGFSLLFVGDSAHGPLFRGIRRAYGAHSVAIVPIGAYEPRHEVRHVHASPEEAVRIASDVGARVAIGAHWGTFPLSDEPFLDPARRFMAAHGGPSRHVLRIGEAMVLGREAGKDLVR